MNQRTIGVLLVLLAATAWSLGGLGIKLVDAGGLSIGGWRSAFALPVLLFAIGPRVLAATAPTTLRSRWVWGAAISYAVCVVTFAAATRLTTAANAIVLQYTGPLYVALLSGPFLGEKVRWLDLVTVVGCLAGMTLFAFEDLSLNGRAGIALALVSGVAFGALPLMLRRELASTGGDPLSPVAALVLGNVLAVVGTLPMMITDAPVGAFSWAVLAGLGTIQIASAYLLYAAGLRRLRAVEASLISTLEPILNPIWVFLGTGERPGSWATAGGIVIVGAVLAQGAMPLFAPRPERR